MQTHQTKPTFTIGEISGLRSGNSTKLLAPIPMGNLGRVSLGILLGAFALKMIVVDDKEAQAKIEGRLHRKIKR